MHQELYAQCTINLALTTQAPLLVRSVQADADGGDSYRALHPMSGRPQYCIPATTLKGVWRSGIERILRTFDPALACDPFAQKGPTSGCSHRLQRGNPASVYAALCPACRLFGSTAHSGLVRIQDAWAPLATKPMETVGIAIDRFVGSAKTGAIYTIHPLPAGVTFPVTLTLNNPDWWHLGLLALIWREMTAGHLRLGSNTHRGLGLIGVGVDCLTLRYPARQYAQAAAQHAGRLCPASALASSYPLPLRTTDQQWVLSDLNPSPSTGWRDELWTTFALTGDQIHTLFQHCVNIALAPRLQAGRAHFDGLPSTANAEGTTHG